MDNLEQQAGGGTTRFVAPDKMSVPGIPKAGYILFLLMLAYLLSFFDRQILILMVKPIHRDLLLNDTQFGLLYGSAFVIFYAILGLVFGRIIDSTNRTKVLALSVLIWSLATAGCGLAGSFGHLLLARAFLGVGEAGLAPAAYSLIADLYPPHKRGMAFSIYGQGIYLGAGLAFALGGTLVAFFDKFSFVDLGLLGTVRGWQVAFFVAAAPGLVIAALIAVLREPQRNVFSAMEAPAAAENDETFLRHYLRHWRAYIPHNLGYSLFMAQAYALSVWLPSYYVRDRGWDIASIGIIYGVMFMVFAPAGSLLGGAFATRLLRRHVPDAYLRLSAAGFLVLAFGTLGAVLIANAAMSLICMAVAIAMIGFPTGLNAASLQVITPGRFRGIAAGTFFAFSNLIGLGLGPLAVAAITDYIFKGPKYIGVSLACAGFVVLPIAAVILWRARQRFAVMVPPGEAVAA